MKKLMIALAIVAIASVAQAELLATWSTADNSGTVTDGADGVVVSGLSLWGDSAKTTSTTDIWGMNSMDGTGGGFQFTITSITGGTQVDNAVIASSITGSGTGPRTMDWYIGSTLVAGQSITRTVTTAVAFSSTLGTLVAGDVVSLRTVTTAGTVRSGTAEAIGSGGTVRLVSTPMTLNGDIAGAVPEPATMSLLGLGALAMALRRKMKK